MKRLLSAYASDIKAMNKSELKQSIKASEGRILLGETVVTAAPLIAGVSNAEMMSAFGCDLLVLNEFDVFSCFIQDFYTCDNPIAELKRLTGSPIGINLEPVDEEKEVMDEQMVLSPGRKVSLASLQRANELGVDFILLTGNPSTGVSLSAIEEAIFLAVQHFNGLIFAGKMHGAGLGEAVVNEAALLDFVAAGADGILIPAVGTVPGVREDMVAPIVTRVKQAGALVMSTIGTSQESADSQTVREFGLSNKRVGTDIHHIGDGGYGRMPDPENIMALSLAVRGKRHTYFRMGQSILR
ncbi:haloacid dehalogenase-like hydrolase [Streptococcus acidominimus]|uniref:Haloacid dehalogenase-like hydrolase n=1 Tax=Streptococcus acidominimus TaxID=1326 RepID=A0A4Y9FLC9_STRAI|nr:haloacid dehalogenase-like hydrolase [Streptococcus acidominimus]MBF0819474.1 haloacid dehalogenase-like hydrolase [Streptococcus acidominimus]MBF0839911.1 haloacid dehalogenase-like hydrolase [Streptococcus acidominimus]MBF0847692.1 haloacid dehalogenase-like hydrolase [Streptococcus danieliae]TFU29846.1 haloacid dehalogenase-like hydrolase [Streptococcus acidominimus]